MSQETSTPAIVAPQVLLNNHLKVLALELKELMEADVDFGVDITGFSIAEVDQLIEGLMPSEPGDPADDRLPEPEAVPSRCQPGDLWQLGPHRLICGDALDPRIVADLLDRAFPD